MPNIPDPFYIIQESIASIKNEINSLADKYNNSVRELWIELTEIKTKIAKDAEWENRNKAGWYKSWPIIISILALLLSAAGVIKDFVTKIK
jgi:hypothetical protein